jgi:tRNA nucleotidyltransferase/poly(A) polymerase
MTGEEEELYAGRWIARLGRRVIAQGGTPEQARQAAQSRFKEIPEILFMPGNKTLQFPKILDLVRVALPDDMPVYLVGGAVRDALLGTEIHDLDFVLQRDAIKMARRVARRLKADFYPLDDERDTGRILAVDEKDIRIRMDFAAFRGRDLESDLVGRDFTLNAIAYDLRDNTIHDPLGGAQDLQEMRLRACSQISFSDDPVRILRGIRLAANFGFSIDSETREAMKKAAYLSGDISPERLRDELFRLLNGAQPATCLRALDMLGVLAHILPELSPLKGFTQPAPHFHDVWEHTLATMVHLEAILASLAVGGGSELEADLPDRLMVQVIGSYRAKICEIQASTLTGDRSHRSLLFLAALYHDVAKPLVIKNDEQGQMHFWNHDQVGAQVTAVRARALMMSNEETAWLQMIISNHLRILFHIQRLVREGKPPSRRAIYRFFRDTGMAGMELCLLALADLRATYEQTFPQETWAAALEVVRLMLENWFEKPGETVDPPVLVNGDDLMKALALEPGKKIGELLEAIREAQAMGDVSTRAQALKLAKKRLLN